ncbi:hypothetical protein AGMMS49936_00670 [Endomicrobiia bacterium]|nr:hypothetical protein AGMMS49936_00670 [Endomicrobiia bacterium]
MMKLKRVLSMFVLFGLVLSSCDSCNKNACLVNRRTATPERIEQLLLQQLLRQRQQPLESELSAEQREQLSQLRLRQGKELEQLSQLRLRQGKELEQLLGSQH